MDDDFRHRQDARIAAQIDAARNRRIWAAKFHKEHERRREYGNKQRHAEKIARMKKIAVVFPVTAEKVEGSRTKFAAFQPNGMLIWVTVPTEWIVKPIEPVMVDANEYCLCACGNCSSCLGWNGE